jgi:hypothetical protein
VLGQGQNGGWLLQTVAATVIGAEHESVLGPSDGWVVEFQPRHAKDDRIMAEAGNVELNIFCVVAYLELNWQGFLIDRTGRDWAPVDHLKLSGHGFGLEMNAVTSGERSVDKRGRCP